jgi:hypothetical protein
MKIFSGGIVEVTEKREVLAVTGNTRTHRHHIFRQLATPAQAITGFHPGVEAEISVLIQEIGVRELASCGDDVTEGFMILRRHDLISEPSKTFCAYFVVREKNEQNCKEERFMQRFL